MTTSIALLRAVNVGGNRKLPMAGLREMLAAAGFERVRTYIQSGNIVLDHGGLAGDALAEDLEQRITATAGFAVPVVVRTSAELAAVAAGNPFLPDREPSELHVAFFASEPVPAALESLAPARFAPDEMVLAGRDAYLHLRNGVAGSKLPPALDRLGPAVTSRNWRTVNILLELAGG